MSLATPWRQTACGGPFPAPNSGHSTPGAPDAPPYPQTRPTTLKPTPKSTLPLHRSLLDSQSTGPRETAEDRALSRFLSNRLKRQGTLVPPSPSPFAPVLDTTVLATYVREQLRHGITDEAQVLSRSSDAAGLQSAGEEAAGGPAGEQAVDRGGKVAGGAGGKAPRKGVVIAPPARIPGVCLSYGMPVWKGYDAVATWASLPYCTANGTSPAMPPRHLSYRTLALVIAPTTITGHGGST